MTRRVEQLDALGQEDRLRIFRLLVRAGPEGKCVDEIKRRLKLPGSTLSHHLDALARSGLLGARRDGRFIYHAINWRETAALIRFLTEDCCADMHLKLDEVGAEMPATGDGNRGRCCNANPRAAANGVRVRRKSKDLPEAQNG
jgi:ArsR family transcriptional regulator, arsenate/arsenite/antimonite-responsive transcriptional repressor